MRKNCIFEKNATPDDLRIAWIRNIFTVSQAWEFGLEAPASRFAKLELRLRGSQSGDWEPAQYEARHIFAPTPKRR